jgi:hypothetical protein
VDVHTVASNGDAAWRLLKSPKPKDSN